ncbi:MAG: hypothetical protein WC747_00640 [Candidatus Babeliales bacterium]|jgi:hypothetical protein
MKKVFKAIIMAILCNFYGSFAQGVDSYPSSIFVPRQLTFNPILENALMSDAQLTEEFDYIFCFKPIYTQTVGSKFQKYFTIGHKCLLSAKEDNSGDINPLWFKVISSDDSFYNSTLLFRPKRQTFGSLLYFAAQLPHNFKVTVNTALIISKNDLHFSEKNIETDGTVSGYRTITQSFSNPKRLFGKICGDQIKTGFDDIQVKVIYNPYQTESLYFDLYGLLGIPTGSGSKARFLFEPLVGSKHVQLGTGANIDWSIKKNDCIELSLLSEAKYRYAFKAEEYRSFDLKNNGQWSRYMLFVHKTDKNVTYPAINDLTFNAQVTPQSSFDLYLAMQCKHNAWSCELGYDFWYRSAETISLCKQELLNIAVADLKGIAATNPESASMANISQGVQPGSNQMVSDISFTPVSINDINLCSGAQSSSLSNSVYFSIGYKFDSKNYTTKIGINSAYERDSSSSKPDTISTWFNVNLYF